MPAGAIILAGGAGRRFKTKQPKQLFLLNGEPLFLRSLRVFLSVPGIKSVVLVVPEKSRLIFERILRKKRLGKKVVLALGGRYRGESVKNGFLALPDNIDSVLVHDSARPLVTRAVASRVLRAARRFGCALPVWQVTETLKRGKNGQWVLKTIPRSGLWTAQTPQGFSSPMAKKVLPFPSESATDDVSLAEAKGFRVKMVEGDPMNIKVTTKADLALCKIFLKA